MTCILVLEMMEREEICTASAYAASQPQVHLGVQKAESSAARISYIHC